MESANANSCSQAPSCPHILKTTPSFTTTKECFEHAEEKWSLQSVGHHTSEDNHATHCCQLNVATEDQDQSALLGNLRDLCLALATETTPYTSVKVTSPESDSGLPATASKRIWRMLTTIPKGDQLHWSAISYHLGAQFFIVNTLLAWFAYAYPETELPGQTTYGVGLTTLPANIFFLIGAYLELVDTLNKLEHMGGPTKDVIDYGSAHSIPNGARLMNQDARIDVENGIQRQAQLVYAAKTRRHWWMPCLQLLRKHSTYDSAVTACAIQLVGATVYIMTGVADLPGISSILAPSQKIWLYWCPNIIASACFVGASIVFMLGTQEEWYKPAPQCAVWWATAWAFIGSLGFLLNGVLGPASYASWNAGYHCLLANVWGSVAFLFSSTCQIYESANKRVIDTLPDS